MTALTTSGAALCAALALVAARPVTAQAVAQGAPAERLPSVTLPPELARVLRDYERAWTGSDPAGLAALFTPDGFVLGNGRPPVRGRAAIQAGYANAGGTLRLRAMSYATDDTVGYIIGAYAYEDALQDAGKFVLALRRAPNGPWLIAADIDNSNRSPRSGQSNPAPAAGGAAADSSWRQWEADIRRFEAQDRAQRPDTGGVLFVGSSSIRMWDSLTSDFPGARATNRGFGGSELRHVVHFADRIILPYRPRLVVVYAGDNDINAGRTPEQVLADFQALVRTVHAARPATRIAFISIKPSPARWALADRARMANSMVQRYVQSDARLAFIDVFDPMLGFGGRPRAELFVSDSLHMTPAGYRLWRTLVEPYLAPR